MVLSKLLKTGKGLKGHDIHTWMPLLGRVNPHISNRNRIFPGERILIPETLNENVIPTRVWQNAFLQNATGAHPVGWPDRILFAPTGPSSLFHSDEVQILLLL
jgi:hypothetical protein